MSLDRCVSGVAKELGLDEADVREIADALARQKKRIDATGRADSADADLRRFAQERAEQAKIAAALKRRQAALNILRRAEWDDDLGVLRGEGLDQREAILAKLVGSYTTAKLTRKSVAARRISLESEWLGSMLNDLQRDLPHVVALLRKPAQAKPLMDNVVREMREMRKDGRPGITGDADAKRLAEIFRTYSEASRVELNRAGANIGRLDGWSPQSHDAWKVGRATAEEWAAFVIPRLDLERSFPDVDPDKLPAVLREVHRTIVTGEDRSLSPPPQGQRLGPANLARSMEKHRELHFKDADAWIEYSGRFGRTGGVAAAMIDHLRMAARKASLMQVMGPNPHAFLDGILGTARREIRDDASLSGDRATKALDRINADLNRRTGAIGKAFAEVSGDTFRPHDVKAAHISSGIRAVQSMAKLGGAVLSSITDLVTYAHAMRRQGKGIFQSYADAFAALAQHETAERQKIARLAGVGFDTMLGDIHSRFTAEDGVPGRMARAQQTFFRLSGLTWWTDRLTNAFARMSSANMADHAGMAFDALPEPYRRMLESHGIDAGRWDVVRQAIYDAEDGTRYIVPESIRDSDDELVAPVAQRHVADIKLDVTNQWAKLRQADRREAEWVTNRVARFRDKLARATERLRERETARRDRQGRARSEIEGRITTLGERLSELAELADATSVDRRTIGRAEGRLAEKAAEAERAIEAILGDKDLRAAGLTDEFEALWRDRQDALTGRADAAKESGNKKRQKAAHERIAEFRAAFDAARQKLGDRLARVDEAAAQRVDSVSKRIAGYAQRLSEIDEAARALNFNRRLIGRDEGDLGRRVKAMESDLRKRDAAADRDIEEMGAEFQELWGRRQNELGEWLTEMQQRGARRAERLAALPEQQERRIADAVAHERREIERRLRGLFADEAGFAVLRADDRTRMFLTQGTQPGTALGEAIRFVMQFKAFPVAFSQKILGRGIRDRDYGGLAEVIAASWVFGYAAMTAKDIVKNRTPKDPTKWETMLAALVQGGGAGIYGDFLFSKVDRFQGGIAGKIVGPVPGTGVDMLEMAAGLWHGDTKASDAFYLALNNTPYLNLWYTRAALDLAVLNSIQDWINPGAFRRRERKMRRDFGQEFIVDPMPLQ